MPTPDGFDAYWSAVLAELAALPAAPECEELPIRSTEEAVCYGLRFTSIGPYRLFAYLSIPRGRGPFPAIYLAHRYQSVVEVLTQGDAREKRSRFVTLSIATRGQRNADRPYAAAFPGLLADGIDDPQTYVFRGIVADCVRGLEMLLTRPEVDPDRVAIVGSTDLALLTAALLPQVRLVATDCDLFHAAREMVPRSTDYPLEEINDLLRGTPAEQREARRETVFRTLDFFDPIHFAARVQASCLMRAYADGGPHDRASLEPLAAAIAGPAEVWTTTESRYLDGLKVEEWVNRGLGFADAILPAIWR